jgi:hypothetical protein
MTKRYSAVRFHPNGDYMFRRENVSEYKIIVASSLDSHFLAKDYPIQFVLEPRWDAPPPNHVTDLKISDAPKSLSFLVGRPFAEVRSYLQQRWKENADAIATVVSAGLPFDFVYHDDRPTRSHIGADQADGCYTC